MIKNQIIFWKKSKFEDVITFKVAFLKKFSMKARKRIEYNSFIELQQALFVTKKSELYSDIL
jgi:hypothetical protein